MPAIINRLVMIYTSTIAVRTQAILFASESDAPDFSPNALDQIRHTLLDVKMLFDC